MVNTVEGKTVEIENIVAVVDVGGTEVDLEQRTFSEREFAFDAEVEAVIVGQSTRIEFAVGYSVFAVSQAVVSVDSVGESDIFVHALCLSERIAATVAPSPAEFPFMLFARTVRDQKVDGVAAVVMGEIFLEFVGACNPT